MTGRDYKQLIKLHRESKINIDHIAKENYKFLSKLVDKSTLVKYDPVNYDLFKDFIKERKDAANESLGKVKKLEDCSKLKRESLFMKQHSVVWLREWIKLINHSKNVEVELEDYYKLLKHNSVDYFNLNNDNEDYNDEDEEYNHLFDLNQIDELEKYRNQIEDERIKFKVRTVLPLNDLKEDLQYYMSKNPKNVIKNNNVQNNQILETINMVKQQQQDILDKLEYDCNKLINELEEPIKQINKGEMTVAEGIPVEAFELECPNEELRVSVLQEFLIIDSKYKEKLKQLNENYSDLFEAGFSNKHGGWTRLEHEIFLHILEQYNNHNISLVNCNFSLRDLIFDRIKKTFLTMNRKIERNDFLKHEEWTYGNKYYHQHTKLIINEWNESRKALLVKAEATFAEAFEMINRERSKNEEKEKQLRICNELYEKVSRWRNQKLEALEIQQKIDSIIKKQNMEKIRIENQRRNQKRMEEKQAIQEYYNRIESNKKIQEQEEQKRLEKIKIALREQAEKDRERIEYRNKLILEKKTELQNKKSNKKQEEEEKEKKLEKFYESVKPKVEADPIRLISYTEAELNRRGVHRSVTLNDQNEKFEDKKQIFAINYSFTDKQLNADARLRIEERLRQAGLIKSDYAKAIMQTIMPASTQNRRDLSKNSHWKGFAMD